MEILQKDLCLISEHFYRAIFLHQILCLFPKFKQFYGSLTFRWHASTDFPYSHFSLTLFVYGNLEVWWRGQTWQSCAPELEAYEVGIFDEDGQKCEWWTYLKQKQQRCKQEIQVFILVGMVEWPFQRLLVTSTKRSGLNDLVYRIGACSSLIVQLYTGGLNMYPLLPSV